MGLYIIRYRGYDNYAGCKQAVLAYVYGSYNPNRDNHKGLIPREEYQPFAVYSEEIYPDSNAISIRVSK